MTPREEHLETALRLSEEMLHDGHATRKCRVVDLTNQFGFVRNTREVRAIVDEALAAVGITTMPPRIADLSSPNAAVQLHRTAKKIGDPSLKAALRELLHLSVWTTGHPHQMVRREDIADRDPVVTRAQLTWFHIDLRGDSPPIDTLVLFEFLAERCPGISLEVIDDLLEPDAIAGSRRHGIDRELRVVSVPEIIVERDPARLAQLTAASESGAQSRSGILRRRMTEIAAGERWVLTVWHMPSWHGKGLDRDHSPIWTGPEGPDPQYPAVVDLVLRRWEVAPDAQSGYDLAMMILIVVANGHADARRAMYTWLDDWDADFYLQDARPRGGSTPDRFERATLLDLRQLVTLFRTDAVALNSPEAGIENAWFPGRLSDAQQLNAMLDRTVEDLRDLSDGIRTAFDMLATAGMEQALLLAKSQEDSAIRLNRLVQMAGLLLLGPSLVASLLAVPTNIFNVAHAGLIILVFTLGVSLTLLLVYLSRTQLARSAAGLFDAMLRRETPARPLPPTTAPSANTDDCAGVEREIPG